MLKNINWETIALTIILIGVGSTVSREFKNFIDGRAF